VSCFANTGGRLSSSSLNSWGSNLSFFSHLVISSSFAGQTVSSSDSVCGEATNVSFSSCKSRTSTKSSIKFVSSLATKAFGYISKTVFTLCSISARSIASSSSTSSRSRTRFTFGNDCVKGSSTSGIYSS